MLFKSESSRNRVLTFSSERSFPPGFPVFLENLQGIYDVSSLRFRYSCDELITKFPVFMSKPFSYLTIISEFCNLKSGFGFLQATSVSG